MSQLRAPLVYNGDPELTIICPFCSNSVIVPTELRPHYPDSQTEAENGNKDFYQDVCPYLAKETLVEWEKALHGEEYYVHIKGVLV